MTSLFSNRIIIITCKVYKSMSQPMMPNTGFLHLLQMFLFTDFLLQFTGFLLQFTDFLLQFTVPVTVYCSCYSLLFLLQALFVTIWQGLAHLHFLYHNDQLTLVRCVLQLRCCVHLIPTQVHLILTHV